MNSAIKPYILGFILSLMLTFGAYVLVINHLLNGQMLLAGILTLAIMQLMVQLYFFLHLGKEKRPHWNLVFFVSTAGIVLIVVVGSIWIMGHLNYNMTPRQVNQYVQSQDGF